MPLQAVTTLEARPNVPLFQALVNLLKQETEEAVAIRQAIDWYFLANADSDSVSLRIEVVMMASAFEALLQVQDESGKKKALMEYLPILFASCLTEEVEKRPWKVWWMDEFYWLRNRITHGGKIDTARMTWTFEEHLTIAALLLGICVKLKLAQLGRYTLAREDETRADFIDFFVADGNLSEKKLLEHLKQIMPDKPIP